MTPQVGEIISGYQNELGVTLNKIKAVNEETTEIEVVIYEPTNPDFAWAVDRLAELES